jgi:hypothetical protein
MVHEHGYLTLKFRPTDLPTGQKLDFLSPAIPTTSENNPVMAEVNSTMINCKNFCKCHNVPPVQ